MARATSKRRAATLASEKSKIILAGRDDSDDENTGSKIIYDSYSDEDDFVQEAEQEEEPEEVEVESEVSTLAMPSRKRRRTGITTSTAVVTKKNSVRASLVTPVRKIKQESLAPYSAGSSKATSISGDSNDDNWAVDTPATSASISYVSSIRSTRSRSNKNDKTVESVKLEYSSAEEEVKLTKQQKGKQRAAVEVVITKASTGKGKQKASKYFEEAKEEEEVVKSIPNSEGDDSDFEILSELSELNSDEEAALEAHVADSDDDDDDEDMPAVRRNRNRQTKHKLPRAERERNELHSRHPYLATLWDDLAAYERIKVEKAAQPSGLSLTMLPFQLEGLNWLLKQERTRFNGGILADEMGMGKTIQTIALLMAEPRHKPNLVVAPTVALMQWRSEIEKHTNNALKVMVFHGTQKSNQAKEFKKYDVILTTYNVLESAFRKQNTGFRRKDEDGGVFMFKESSVLHALDFHRVILDEAHNIKDRSCNTARAVFSLKTKYKLCLSGTPLQNRIGELFSLLRFLEADPFSMYFCRKCDCKSMHWKFSDRRHCDQCKHRPMDHMCWFNYELLRPIQNNGNTGAGKVAFANLQLLLSLIMLRRTKVERADDLGLPPRVVKVRRDYFNEEELDLYDSIYGQSRRKFNTYVASGVVLNNYANIFTLITRMRQLADHPDLVLRKHSDDGQNNLVCTICDDEAEEAIKSKCHHTFCRMCVQKYIESYAGDEAPECPRCHVTLAIDLTQPAMELDQDLAAVKKNSIVNRINMSNWRSSTKIEALVEELANLRSKSSTIKSIVFSQFTSMLQLVEWRLRKAGFLTVMLEGSMSPTQREASIKYFMETPEVEVFLVSLKAGGVALNLVEASQVFILDPWWNPSVEWQSGDRIHRIGQTRNCRITRLVIEDSIESRIIELQEKKANMINATVGNDQAAMEKLSEGDLQFLFQN